ncbi:hypothetical protein E2K98_30330 [Bacillus salipaludis]|uniref:Uncharacterized protein n=1 Tax=Bacillus salipaludis TaxID=2547811 RepID=A0A4R5VIP3_9BACI|nr:hypothetical protein [Bacillus salipaludis]MDQ6597969.1 hypothetical protein [Bacillus salipaludis]TDK53034.1 hypothetical protein E2K98_30330 [Bacillus salipaludis]
MKKIVTILAFVVMLFSSSMWGSVAFADTASTSKPSVTYGSTGEFGKVTYSGPWPVNKWSYYGYAYKYNSWDRDAFEAINYAANVSLSASSQSTYSLSGSTEFGIKTIAKANISGSWGQTWGKTSTVTFDATKGYVYELWSAK